MKINSNDQLFYGHSLLIKYSILLLFIFFIFRTIYSIYFGGFELFIDSPLEMLKAYTYGLRYDLMAISFALLPFVLINILISIFASSKKLLLYRKCAHLFFYFITILFVILLVADLGFYSYFQDHTNILIFGFFEDDTEAILSSIYNNYPLIQVGIGVFVLLVLLWYFFKKITYTKFTSLFKNNPLFYILQILVVLVLLMGGLRGGYSNLVLAPKYSDFSNNEFINSIAYNGVLAFERAWNVRAQNTKKDFKLEDTLGYKNKIKKAFHDYNQTNGDNPTIDLTRKTSLKKNHQNKHVVFFLMESFGASWLQYQSSEFDILGSLKTHLNDDAYTPYMISSGRGTIGSLVALMTNNPRRPGRRFLSESEFMNLKLESSVVSPYKRNGYESVFVYGGKLAWRNVGNYAKTQGFDLLIGENQIKEELNLKGVQGTEWGLYDEHLHTYIKNRLEKATKPQFIFVLTTTNHPPFQFPEKYKYSLKVASELDKQITREKDLFVKRFETFRYTNEMLADFISFIKSHEKLKDETVISFTGDHNFWGFKNYKESELYLKYTVPFYIYDSNLKEKISNQLPMGHEDIFTTLYNLTLSETDYISFGDDVLKIEATNAIGPKIYANQSGVYFKDRYFEWEKFPLIKTSPTQYSKEHTIFYRSILSLSDYFIRYQSKN